MTWTVVYSSAAQRDVKKIKKRYPHLLARVKAIDKQLHEDPLHATHRFEALRGNLTGYYSRRLDGFQRMVYRIEEPDVIVVSCLGHYGDS